MYCGFVAIKEGVIYSPCRDYFLGSQCNHWGSIMTSEAEKKNAEVGSFALSKQALLVRLAAEIQLIRLSVAQY